MVLWSQSDRKCSLGSRRAYQNQFSRGVGVLQMSYRTGGRIKTQFCQNVTHQAQDPQSSLLTYPYLMHEQCSGFCPTSGPHHMRLCQWLRSTKHWGHSAGGRSTWNMTSNWVLLHRWNLCNMLLPPPAHFMTRNRRSQTLGQQKHNKNMSMELSQR